MFRGERSKTATGGDGDDTAARDTALYDTVPCAGWGDFDTKPFVRAQAAAVQAVVTGTVSSSDMVKSITLSSLPLTTHAATVAAAAEAAAVVVVVGAGAGTADRTFRGVSALSTHKNTHLANTV